MSIKEIQTESPRTVSRPTMKLSWRSEQQDGDREAVLVMDKTDDGSLYLWRNDRADKLATALLTRLKDDGRQQAYRFHLWEMSSWMVSGDVSRLRLDVSAKDYRVEIKSLRFLSLAREIPTLAAENKSVPWSRMEPCLPGE